MNVFSSELDKIANKYYEKVYAYCLSRTMNIDIAMEITQTVFLSLCENYEARKINNVECWLRKVAQNQVAQYLRDKYKEQHIFIEDEFDDDRITASYNPFEEVSDAEIKKIMETVINSLSDDERNLFESCFGKNKLDSKTNAESLKISEPALRKRISRLKIKIISGIKSMLYCFILFAN